MKDRSLSKNNTLSLYTLLCKACKVYKAKDNLKDVGCAGGKFQRFSPSNISVYNEETVLDVIESVNIIFAKSTFNFNEKNKRKLTPMICFECYLELEKELLKLDGIGKVRATHLIQLSALLGLIPLHFYVYLPVHMEGGTGKFMLQELGYKNNSAFLNKYQEDLIYLQKIYGLNFTSNMFENMACILGRGKEVHDIFYYLPWVTKDRDKKHLVVTDKTNIQLTFRINVKSIKNIELLCRSNNKESTVLTTIPSSSSSNVLEFKKTRQKDFGSIDGFFLAENGHTVNHIWMDTQYCNDINIIRDLNIMLPQFERFYEHVRKQIWRLTFYI